MDRTAVISDIHGNMPAFEAVLADIEARGIARIFCLGDLIGKGPSGSAVVDLCRSVCDRTVHGNWDVMIADNERDMAANEWHRHELGAERIDYLRDLPSTIDFALSGRHVRLFHASEKSVFHRVHQHDAHDKHAAMFENTPFTGDTKVPDIVGYGDIHIGYVKCFAQKCLFNAGSVGNPLDITLACYAIIEGDYGSRDTAPWTVTIVRVPYDVDESIRQAEASDMPDLEHYVNELRTARYRSLTAAR